MKNKKLLIVRTDAIGDYILFRNFIKYISKSNKYKNYKIDMLCHDSWIELSEFLDKKYISNFISFNSNKYSTDHWYKLSLESELNQFKYHTILYPVFSRTFLTDLLINNLYSENKIAYNSEMSNITIEQKNISDRYYNELINPKNEFEFEFERNKFFFESVLKEKINISKTKINLKRKIDLPFGRYIVIMVGGSNEAKKWDILNYIQIAKELIHLGYNIVLCGSGSEADFSVFFNDNLGYNYIDLIGKTSLLDILEILNQAKLVISNDTGIAHISIALKKETYVISKGNHFGRFFPYPSKYKNVHSFLPFNYKRKFKYFSEKFRISSTKEINLIEAKAILNKLNLRKIHNNPFNNSFKSKFIDINRNINFSKDYNIFYNYILSLGLNYQNLVIYGNGTIGKTIRKLIPEKIVGYVDIKDINHHPSTLKQMKYDKILISVLGREKEIIEYLTNALNISIDKIITLEV
jgi:ADP-heptose:LPS heptosyltransferase